MRTRVPPVCLWGNPIGKLLIGLQSNLVTGTVRGGWGRLEAVEWVTTPQNNYETLFTDNSDLHTLYCVLILEDIFCENHLSVHLLK